MMSGYLGGDKESLMIAEMLGPLHKARLSRMFFAVREFLPLAALLAIVTVVSYSGAPDRLSGEVFLSLPREKTTFELGRQWVTTGEPVVHDERLMYWPDELRLGLVPRDAGVDGNRIVPSDSALSVMLIALAWWVGGFSPALLAPLGALCLAYAAYALARKLSNSRAIAAGCIALFVVSPPFASIASRGVSVETMSAAALVLGVLLLVARKASRVRLNAAAVGGLLAFAVGARYPSLLLAVPVLLAALYDVRSRRQRAEYLLWAFIGALPFIAAVLWFNVWIYGHPFRTGYRAKRHVVDPFISASPLDQLWQHLSTYGWRPWTLVIIVLGSWGIFHRFSDVAELRNTRLGVWMGCMLLALIAGMQVLWGDQTYIANASFLRYTAPGLALLAAWSSRVLPSLIARSRAWLPTLVVVALLGLASSILSDGGVMDLRRDARFGEELYSVVGHLTEPEAAIYGWSIDKWLWPDHTVVVGPNLVSEDGYIWLAESFRGEGQMSPMAHRVAQHVDTLVDLVPAVYLLREIQHVSGDFGQSLVDELGIRGHTLIPTFEWRNGMVLEKVVPLGDGLAATRDTTLKRNAIGSKGG